MQINKKLRPALACQTEQGKITITNSIAYLGENIPAVKDCPIGIDSFKGTVRDFKSYLSSQLMFLNAGVIAP